MNLDKRIKSQWLSEEEHDFLIGTPMKEPLWCNTSYMRAWTFQNHVSFP